MLEINLALVGHTNVGKTSLLRTLSYNSYFGEVSYKASTTRHIEKATLNFDNLNLNFFDTPGLEDASGLLDYLEDMPKTSRNGLERLEAFFATKVAITDFSQEMKVLKQLIQSDLGLYVVDVREPFLNKYYDELVLLRDCAKPLLLIFNFLGEEKYLTIWQEQVKTLGIHKVIYFDAQNPQDGEENLYKALAFMLPQYQKSLDEALNALTLKKYHKISQALFKTSDMLIDCISFKMIIKQDDDLNELKTIIRKRESSNIQDILKAFNFPVNQQLTANHIFNNGRFENDLFSFESLKTFTSRISDAFLKGAGGGFSLDLMFGGTTLGLASLLGGVAGATAQVIRYYGSKISRMFSSETAKEVSVPDEIIILLTARAFSLISEFSKVGHAQSSFTDEIFQKVDFDINLTATMQKARYHEEFCLLNGKNKTSGKREEFLEKLQAELLEIYQKANS